MAKGPGDHGLKYRRIENHHGACDRGHAAGQHNKELPSAKARQHGADRQGRFHHPHEDGYRSAEAHGATDLEGFP